MMSSQNNHSFVIGSTVFHANIKSIEKGQLQVSLENKPSELLVVLCLNANEVVSKDKLLDKVWGQVIVTDQSLTRAVSQIRKAFKQIGETGVEIKAITKHGYILTGDVKALIEPQNTEKIQPTVGVDHLSHNQSTENGSSTKIDTSLSEPQKEEKTKQSRLLFLSYSSLALCSMSIVLILFNYLNREQGREQESKWLLETKQHDISIEHSDIAFIDVSPNGEQYLYLSKTEDPYQMKLSFDSADPKIANPVTVNDFMVGGAARWLNDSAILVAINNPEKGCYVAKYSLTDSTLKPWYTCQYPQRLVNFDVIDADTVLIADGELGQHDMYLYNHTLKTSIHYPLNIGKNYSWPWIIKVDPSKSYAVFSTTLDYEKTLLYRFEFETQVLTRIAMLPSEIYDFTFVNNDSILYFDTLLYNFSLLNLHSGETLAVLSDIDNATYLQAVNNDIFVVADSANTIQIKVLDDDYKIIDFFELSSSITRPHYVEGNLYFIREADHQYQIWKKGLRLEQIGSYSKGINIRDYLIAPDAVFVATDKGVDKWQNGVKITISSTDNIRELILSKNDAILAIAGQCYDSYNLVWVEGNQEIIYLKNTSGAIFDPSINQLIFSKSNRLGLFALRDGREYVIHESIGGIYHKIYRVYDNWVWVKDIENDRIYKVHIIDGTVQAIENIHELEVDKPWNGGFMSIVVGRNNKHVSKAKLKISQ